MFKNIKTIALITHDFHMRRSAMIFKKYGFLVIPMPVDKVELLNKNKLLWFIPCIRASELTGEYIHEIVGYLYDYTKPSSKF